jgi:hypothetical protein
MAKPKNVKVLGVDYSVTFLPQKQIFQALGVDAVGYCDDLEEKIVIASELTGRTAKKIFIHEWVHAVCGVNGLNQTLDTVVAEAFSQSFASALMEMLDQKQVREFLLKG